MSTSISNVLNFYDLITKLCLNEVSSLSLHLKTLAWVFKVIDIQYLNSSFLESEFPKKIIKNKKVIL